jgi:iron(III) transport system permease protein
VNRWRVTAAALLGTVVALPLALPFLDLLRYPSGWRAWYETGRLLRLGGNTLLLVAGTLLLALPLGTAAAVLLYRTDLPLRKLLRFVIVLTLFVPLPLFASGWEAALGSGGWLPAGVWSAPAPVTPGQPPPPPQWQPWHQGLVTAVWVHALAALPWVVVLVGQGLRWVERELEEDALTVAGPLRVLLRVTLPRSLAALGAAALWVALQTATEISVTDVMQVRTYAEEVFTQFTRPEPDSAAPTAEAVLARAVAVSIPGVVLTWLLIVAAARRWERRLPPLGTLSGPPLRFRLGRWRWPLLAALLAAVAVLAGVPVASLVWKAGLGGDPLRWTAATATRHLAATVQVRGRMLIDNLALVLCAGAVTAGAGLVVSWLAGESRWFRVGVLSLMAAAWALPGPVIGLGLKDAIALVLHGTDRVAALFSTSPGALHALAPLADELRERIGILLYYGPSPVPVFWACVVRFFPFAVALLWPVVRLLPPELRDAARVDGAGPAQELRHVVWPLTYLACLRAAGAVAVLSLGEIGAGKLVETPGSTTFAHEIFNQMHYGVTNDVAAHCLVLLAAVALGGAAVAVCGRLLGGMRDAG